MGRRILRRHIWGYSGCLCPIKGTPGLNELIKQTRIPFSHESTQIYVVCVMRSLKVLSDCVTVFKLVNFQLKAKNYNASLKLRKTIVKVTDFEKAVIIK